MEQERGQLVEEMNAEKDQSVTGKQLRNESCK